jgi:hypothetical protein
MTNKTHHVYFWIQNWISFLKFEYLNANASVYRIELPDGNYEVVPESEGEPAEGEVNVVEVQQDPNQNSRGIQSDFTSGGKPRSITYFC